MSGSSIWTFIGLIVLVSIIAGVSFHDAFWGIVAFVICVTIFFLAIAILGYTSLSIAGKIKAANTPEGRKIREQNRKKRIAKAKSDAMGGLVVLWLFSPLLIVLLPLITPTNPTVNDLTSNHPFLFFTLAASPFLAGLLWFFMFITKGQNRKQRLLTFMRLSWGLIKLFLIVLVVIAGLGLIIVLFENLK